MRGLCQLSARWHQQFFRTARSTGHQQCLQYLRPSLARQYRQTSRGRRVGLGTDAQDNEIKVREFEQHGSNVDTRVSIDPKREIRDDEAAIVAKIKELGRELAIMKEGPFGPNSEFIQAIPEENRATALKELEQAGLLQDNGDGLLEDAEMAEFLEDEEDFEESEDIERAPAVTLRIPKRQKAYVKQFNKSLQAAIESEGDTMKHLNLWKWYLRCQQHVPNFSNVMPEDVWQVLWQSVLEYATRPRYVVLLAKDMLEAGIELDGRRTLAYIEALLSENDAPQALSFWEQKTALVQEDPGIASDYWILGVRLYTVLGRPKKAQEAAFARLEDNSVKDGHILVPVISAWASSRDPCAPQKAWTAYLRLRSALGDRMTVELYRDVSGALLKAGHADLALAVFKDMASSQDRSGTDSTDIYRKAIEHIKDVQSQAVTEDQVNRIGLTALIIFPKRFHNKFFFGSWIKMLIGQGEVDAAATVVELMYERGVTLDAKHLNGIIGAWLREGSAASRQKAERLAWAMINARVMSVQHRRQKTESISESLIGTSVSLSRRSAVEVAVRKVPKFLRRAAPPANIETFSTLLLHYTRREDSSMAEQLTQIMTGPAKITPNAFIMNHWLYSSLRSSDLQGVWDKYNDLKHDIRPDLETFAALWDTGKVEYDRARVAKASTFPSARLLFAEMRNWLSFMPEKQMKYAKDDFSRDLYNTIIRCFYLSSDLPGMLCAMTSIKENFDMYPDETDTQTVLVAVSHVLPKENVRGPQRMKQRRGNLQHSMKIISKVLEEIANQHKVTLMEAGVDLEKLEPESEIAQKAQLDILTEFLLTFMERVKKRADNVVNNVKTVAKVMQVDVSGVDFSCLRQEDDGEMGG